MADLNDPFWRADVAYEDAIEHFERQDLEPEEVTPETYLESCAWTLLAVLCELRAQRIAGLTKSDRTDSEPKA